MMALWGGLALVSAAVLLLTWVIYPAITRHRAGRRPVPPATGSAGADLTVSVILVTKESAAAVWARLEDLGRTTYPSAQLEVIVAFDGPLPEGLNRAPEQVPRSIFTVADDPGGKACGLNSAVRLATGDVLVFTDTHQQFEPGAIGRLVGTLSGGPWGVVSGALQVTGVHGEANLLTRYWVWERRLRHAEALVHSAVGVTGAIYAMWRDRWIPLPAGLILDDLFVPMRRVLAGDRVGFDAGAIASDRRSTSPRQEFLRKVRTLTGNVQLCAWLPKVLSPWSNPIWFGFLCHKLFRLLTPYACLGLGIGLAGLLATISPATASVVALVAAGCFGVAVLVRRIRSALIWGLAMQGAAVVATLNGLRGKWDVWQGPSGAGRRGR